MVRMAVEREFSIIGEAIAGAKMTFPEVMDKISSAQLIVGFPNRLVHGYETIRDETVWEAIQKSLRTSRRRKQTVRPVWSLRRLTRSLL
jgi:uncharacterized protein with HEPN domain